YLLFDEIPDIYSYIGGTIIIAMAIYLYLHNKKKKANNIGRL
ncbi:EamA family transporter, partial [Fusobacterium necrophorum]|nr:EamA family transporter [Fusobacterium necrophorum]